MAPPLPNTCKFFINALMPFVNVSKSVHVFQSACIATHRGNDMHSENTFQEEEVRYFQYQFAIAHQFTMPMVLEPFQNSDDI